MEHAVPLEIYPERSQYREDHPLPPSSQRTSQVLPSTTYAFANGQGERESNSSKNGSWGSSFTHKHNKQEDADWHARPGFVEDGRESSIESIIVREIRSDGNSFSNVLQENEQQRQDFQNTGVMQTDAFANSESLSDHMASPRTFSRSLILSEETKETATNLQDEPLVVQLVSRSQNEYLSLVKSGIQVIKRDNDGAPLFGTKQSILTNVDDKKHAKTVFVKFPLLQQDEELKPGPEYYLSANPTRSTEPNLPSSLSIFLQNDPTLFQPSVHFETQRQTSGRLQQQTPRISVVNRLETTNKHQAEGSKIKDKVVSRGNATTQAFTAMREVPTTSKNHVSSVYDETSKIRNDIRPSMPLSNLNDNSKVMENSLVKQSVLEFFTRIPIDRFKQRLQFLAKNTSMLLGRSVVDEVLNRLYSQAMSCFCSGEQTHGQQCMLCSVLIQLCRHMTPAKQRKFLSTTATPQRADICEMQALLENLSVKVSQDCGLPLQFVQTTLTFQDAGLPTKNTHALGAIDQKQQRDAQDDNKIITNSSNSHRPRGKLHTMENRVGSLGDLTRSLANGNNSTTSGKKNMAFCFVAYPCADKVYRKVGSEFQGLRHV